MTIIGKSVGENNGCFIMFPTIETGIDLSCSGSMEMAFGSHCTEIPRGRIQRGQ